MYVFVLYNSYINILDSGNISGRLRVSGGRQRDFDCLNRRILTLKM